MSKKHKDLPKKVIKLIKRLKTENGKLILDHNAAVNEVNDMRFRLNNIKVAIKASMSRSDKLKYQILSDQEYITFLKDFIQENGLTIPVFSKIEETDDGTKITVKAEIVDSNSVHIASQRECDSVCTQSHIPNKKTKKALAKAGK